MTNKARILFISVILLGSVFTASAQGFDLDSQSVSDAENSLLGFLNQVLVTYEVNSAAEFLLFFLAPLFGFYLINKNIFEVGFESFEDRIGRDNYSYARTDEVPTGLKGVAFAAAFMTVQVAGLLGAIALILASVLGFFSWILGQGGLFRDWRGGGGAGGGAEDVGGEVERLREDFQDLQEQLNEGEEAENQAAEDEESGLPQEAEEDIRAALSHFESGEDDILEILEISQSEIRNITADFRNAVGATNNIDEKIESLLHDIEMEIRIWEGGPNITDDLNSLGPNPFPGNYGGTNYNSLQDMMDDYASNGSDPKSDFQSFIEGNILPNLEAAAGPGAIDFQTSAGGNTVSGTSSDVLDYSENVLSLSLLLRDFEGSGDLHDDVVEAVEILKSVRKIHMFIEELGGDLSNLINEEEHLVEMARKAEERGLIGSDGGLLGSIRSDRRKAEELKSGLQQIENEYSSVLSESENLFNALNTFLGVSEGDIEDLLDHTGGIPHGVNRIAFRLQEIYRIFDHEIYTNFDGSDTKDELNQALNNLSNALNALNQARSLLSSGSSHPTRELQRIGNELGIGNP